MNNRIQIFGIKRKKKRSKNAKGHDQCVCFFWGNFAKKNPVQLIQRIFVKKYAITVRFQIYEIAIFWE
jgi:hypothetical protein